MPNWKNIADTIALGMYGKEWQASQENAQNMRINDEKMGLARSQDSREAAREGRAQEEADYGKTQRGRQEKAVDLTNTSRELSNDEARAQAALRIAKGDVAGEAERFFAEEERKKAAHKQNILESSSRIRNTEADNARQGRAEGRAQSESDTRRRREDLQFDIDQATRDSKINQIRSADDPAAKDAQTLRSMVELSKGASDSDQEWILAKIKEIAMRKAEERVSAPGMLAPGKAKIPFKDGFR